MGRIGILAAALLLGACAPRTPQPYSADEHKQRVADDQKRMYADQEPVTEPITFYQAAARALKYNLDYRLKLMESALAANLRDVASYETLPRVVASAGYLGRSNDSGGTSIGIEDRTVSLRASTSEERHHAIGGLGLSWSLLDFGVAYYRSQQKNDQVLMAEERRRRVAQNVLQDVRNAYWRAVGAQRLLPQVDLLLDRTRKALVAARTAEDKGLLPRQTVLAYQRSLLDSITLLSARRQDLEFARSELRALMSLPPSVALVLADGPEPGLPELRANMQRLEQLSLENRAEISEEWYRKRVNENDLRIAKAQLWPNLTVNLGVQGDTNEFLYNSGWTNASLQASINLLKLLQLPSLEAAQASQTATDDTRRIALSMAILTQVRVGALRYQLAVQELEFADESLRVDRSLLDYATAARTTAFGATLEVIRAEGRHLLSRYQREAAYSSAQAAWGRLYNSVGFNVLPATIENSDIATLAREIEKTVAEQEQRALLAASQDGKP